MAQNGNLFLVRAGPSNRRETKKNCLLFFFYGSSLWHSRAHFGPPLAAQPGGPLSPAAPSLQLRACSSAAPKQRRHTADCCPPLKVHSHSTALATLSSSSSLALATCCRLFLLLVQLSSCGLAAKCWLLNAGGPPMCWAPICCEDLLVPTTSIQMQFGNRNSIENNRRAILIADRSHKWRPGTRGAKCKMYKETIRDREREVQLSQWCDPHLVDCLCAALVCHRLARC